MNKSHLIEALKKETGLTRAKATEAVNLMFNKMTDALVAGDRVEIRGLCSFYVREYKENTGRNPKTGAHTTVAEKSYPSSNAARN